MQSFNFLFKSLCKPSSDWITLFMRKSLIVLMKISHESVTLWLRPNKHSKSVLFVWTSFWNNDSENNYIQVMPIKMFLSSQHCTSSHLDIIHLSILDYYILSIFHYWKVILHIDFWPHVELLSLYYAYVYIYTYILLSQLVHSCLKSSLIDLKKKSTKYYETELYTSMNG